MYCCLLLIYMGCDWLLMNLRRRNTTNAQIWWKKNDSNYDGKCVASHCLSGSYEILRRWIFVRLSVQEWFSKLWSNKYSKAPIFSTNISVLRPFLIRSLTTVSLSADTKHSRSQGFIPITRHGWNILQVYPTDLRNISPNVRPFAFILSMSHIQQSLHNFLFKLTRL